MKKEVQNVRGLARSFAQRFPDGRVWHGCVATWDHEKRTTLFDAAWFCRWVVFTYYDRSVIRAHVERTSVRRPRTNAFVEPPIDALYLEFTFHENEQCIALDWLEDLVMRRPTPRVYVPAYSEAWTRIRNGSRYEWTPMATEFHNALTRARGKSRVRSAPDE